MIPRLSRVVDAVSIALLKARHLESEDAEMALTLCSQIWLAGYLIFLSPLEPWNEEEMRFERFSWFFFYLCTLCQLLVKAHQGVIINYPNIIIM